MQDKRYEYKKANKQSVEASKEGTVSVPNHERGTKTSEKNTSPETSKALDASELSQVTEFRVQDTRNEENEEIGEEGTVPKCGDSPSVQPATLKECSC